MLFQCLDQQGEGALQPHEAQMAGPSVEREQNQDTPHSLKSSWKWMGGSFEDHVPHTQTCGLV